MSTSYLKMESALASTNEKLITKKMLFIFGGDSSLGPSRPSESIDRYVKHFISALKYAQAWVEISQDIGLGKTEFYCGSFFNAVTNTGDHPDLKAVHNSLLLLKEPEPKASLLTHELSNQLSAYNNTKLRNLFIQLMAKNLMLKISNTKNVLAARLTQADSSSIGLCLCAHGSKNQTSHATELSLFDNSQCNFLIQKRHSLSASKRQLSLSEDLCQTTPPKFIYVNACYGESFSAACYSHVKATDKHFLGDPQGVKYFKALCLQQHEEILTNNTIQDYLSTSSEDFELSDADSAEFYSETDCEDNWSDFTESSSTKTSSFD